MATPDLSPEENANLRELVRETIRRLGSQNRLALDLRIQSSSISAFLKGGGWSEETARKFAALIGISYEEALGHRRPRSTETAQGSPPRPTVTRHIPRDRLTPPESGPPAFRPTTRALAIAKAYLRQPPQNFDTDVIDHAAQEIWLETPEAADSPSKVAEALRIAILGSALHFPMHPQQPPSSAPPAGTRRSKMRGR
jgi:hypothetical protein